MIVANNKQRTNSTALTSGDKTLMSEYTTDALYTVAENDTVLQLTRELAKDNPTVTLFNRPSGYGWEGVSAAQFLDEVYAVAKGLIANGIEAGDRVVIMSETRYEWTLVDYAIFAAGGVTVPIYSSSSTSQCEWIVGNSEAKIAFAEDSEHATRLNTFVREGERVDNNAVLDRVFQFNQNGIADIIADGERPVSPKNK